MSSIPIAVHVMHAEATMAVGLETILSRYPEFIVTSHAHRPEAARIARVAVADYDTGLALARGGTTGCVLVVTPLDKEWQVRTALDCGVHGYLPQSAGEDELAKAVRCLGQGQRYLSESVMRMVADSLTRAALTVREKDVLQLLAEGCCNKLIARRLGIGIGTVKTHVKGVMTKLDATARTHAVVVAAERGLIAPGHRARAAYPAGQILRRA